MRMNEDNDIKRDRAEVGVRSQWEVIAEVESRTLAEFAVNGLKSYEIPAVIDSRAGFLGAAGLKLRSLKDGKVLKFKVLVPIEFKDEAVEVVKIFVGGGEDEQSGEFNLNEDDDLSESE